MFMLIGLYMEKPYERNPRPRSIGMGKVVYNNRTHSWET